MMLQVTKEYQTWTQVNFCHRITAPKISKGDKQRLLTSIPMSVLQSSHCWSYRPDFRTYFAQRVFGRTTHRTTLGASMPALYLSFWIVREVKTSHFYQVLQSLWRILCVKDEAAALVKSKWRILTLRFCKARNSTLTPFQHRSKSPGVGFCRHHKNQLLLDVLNF